MVWRGSCSGVAERQEARRLSEEGGEAARGSGVHGAVTAAGGEDAGSRQRRPAGNSATGTACGGSGEWRGGEGATSLKMTTAAARGDARGWPEPGGIAMGAARSSTSSRREEAHEARAKTKEEDRGRPTTDFALVAGGRRRSAGAMRVCVCVAALWEDERERVSADREG